MNLKQRKYYFPIIFLLSWLVFTILNFAFGPYKYNINNALIFYSYLLLVHISLFLGYFWGQSFDGKGTRIKIDYYIFVKIAIVISLIYFVVKLIFTSGGDLRSFSDTLKDALKTYSNSSLNHPTLFSYLDMFFAPISLIAITNTIFSNKNLPKLYRYSVYLLIVFQIGSSVGSATRSGLVYIVIITLAAFSLGIYKKNIILELYHKVLIILLGAGIIIGFFAYSSLIVTKRGGIVAINPLTNEPPKESYFLYKIISPKLQPQITNTSFYISHSYYRLNQALNLPNNGLGFGLSNSWFIMDNIEKYTGWSKPKDISYGVRLDRDLGGGRHGLYWSTFYTWIASDFSFAGTIIVIFFIGYFFSLAMKDSLFFQNPLSVTVFCTFFFFIFHFAFNNPLQDGQGITTFFCLPVVWLLVREKQK
jgi:hypothetical protein